MRGARAALAGLVLREMICVCALMEIIVVCIIIGWFILMGNSRSILLSVLIKCTLLYPLLYPLCKVYTG